LVAYGKATTVPAGPSVSIGEMLAPSESDKAFYERWIESTLAAFNEGDLDALDGFYAQDFVRQEPPNPDVVGLASFKEYISTTRNDYPDLRLTKNGATIAQGEFTAIRGTAKGTSSSGEVDTYEWCAITRWQDKKAVEEWVYSVLAPSQGEE
jgi:ketosteroid isomerase-like protein